MGPEETLLKLYKFLFEPGEIARVTHPRIIAAVREIGRNTYKAFNPVYALFAVTHPPELQAYFREYRDVLARLAGRAGGLPALWNDIRRETALNREISNRLDPNDGWHAMRVLESQAKDWIALTLGLAGFNKILELPHRNEIFQQRERIVSQATRLRILNRHVWAQEWIAHEAVRYRVLWKVLIPLMIYRELVNAGQSIEAQRFLEKSLPGYKTRVAYPGLRAVSHYNRLRAIEQTRWKPALAEQPRRTTFFGEVGNQALVNEALKFAEIRNERERTLASNPIYEPGGIFAFGKSTTPFSTQLNGRASADSEFGRTRLLENA